MSERPVSFWGGGLAPPATPPAACAAIATSIRGAARTLLAVLALSLPCGPGWASVPGALEAPFFPDLPVGPPDVGPDVALLRAGSPDRAVIDLWRSRPNADKILVMAGLPDGSEALFILDTGAAISVIDRDTATRLGLGVQRQAGRVGGLSGDVPWDAAVIPSLRLGGHTVDGVRVAVDVAGVPQTAGALPIAGILGMNVWAAFTMVVDYPRDRLELWRPGSRPGGARGVQLLGSPLQPRIPAELRAQDGTRATIALDVDTGARDVVILGTNGAPFTDTSTRGVEPILGIGASPDELPAESFLRETRRIPLASARIGSVQVHLADTERARWLAPDTIVQRPGLFGYAPMARRRLLIDAPGGRLALLPPVGLPRDFDARTAMLARVPADDPSRGADRARLLLSLERREEAVAALRATLVARPDDEDAAELLIKALGASGDADAAVTAARGLAPRVLAAAGMWVGHVNAVALLHGAASALREGAAADTPSDTDDAQTRMALAVAHADALAAAGRPRAAAERLYAAVGGGTAQHLLRRARYAALDGDRAGAIVALRERLRAWPLDGTPLLLYARLLGTQATPGEIATFRADLDGTLARLHPEDRPLDFAGAALRVVGADAEGRALLSEGRDRDCGPLHAGPARDNCRAWYLGLAGDDLDRAARLVRGALLKVPTSYAYHDTAATIAFARGDLAAARAHAHAAAQLSPADPSLHWQLDRADGKLP